MADHKPLGGPAFPSLGATGLNKREYLASQVDVRAYNPVATLRIKLGREEVTTEELADYIAELRLLEADALLARLRET